MADVPASTLQGQLSQPQSQLILISNLSEKKHAFGPSWLYSGLRALIRKAARPTQPEDAQLLACHLSLDEIGVPRRVQRGSAVLGALVLAKAPSGRGSKWRKSSKWHDLVWTKGSSPG